MVIYNVRIPNLTPSALNTGLFCLVGSIVKSVLILEIEIEGAATISAAAEFAFGTPSSGSAGGGVLTSVPVDNIASSASSPAYLSPTGLSFTPFTTYHSFGINANGQRYFWRAMPNLLNAITIGTNGGASATMALVMLSGTPSLCPIEGRIQFAEI